MPAPMTRSDTIRTIEDALAFEKAMAHVDVDTRLARRVAAMLGELDEAQARRICVAARDERRAEQARIARKRTR